MYRRLDVFVRLPKDFAVLVRTRSRIRDDAEGSVFQKSVQLGLPLGEQVDRTHDEVWKGLEIAVRRAEAKMMESMYDNIR